MSIPYSKSLVLNDLLRHATFSDRLLVDLAKIFESKNDDYLLEVINTFAQNTMLSGFEQRMITESKQKLMNRIEEELTPSI